MARRWFGTRKSQVQILSPRLAEKGRIPPPGLSLSRSFRARGRPAATVTRSPRMRRPMDVHAALKGQFHASLAMLKQAIEQCPDDLWVGGSCPIAFWRVAYHTLFYTHLYLQDSEQTFTPWIKHRKEYQYLGRLPWPPHAPPQRSIPRSSTNRSTNR